LPGHASDQLSGRYILRSSYIGIRGIEHWAAMPNLELFSNAGFLFIRFADLSQTKVVLPHQASPDEMGIYPARLGHFGEQTGISGLRVEVGNSSILGGDADYLVLGTLGDQPAFSAQRKAPA
jgi:cellulose synthase (UDP-forming)